jgi:4-alpha-glucanotransferase
MVQAQDVLGLGSEARMNQPGRASGAWKWRLSALPSRQVATRLRAAAEAAGRDSAEQPMTPNVVLHGL